ncbi:MAG: HAMP domain-containing protein [Deltaproteobacteria bacterium]|nr:HAMP domain-containing protein [Deltaproteobacteria bacterium]
MVKLPRRLMGKKAFFGNSDKEDNVMPPEILNEPAVSPHEKQLRDFLEALQAVKNGDLSRRLEKVRDDIFGEIADCYNGMVENLYDFGDEVGQVLKEIGTEGKLDNQASLPGAAGVWKDVIDSLNLMADNLTNQVKNVGMVATGIANGDITQRVTVEASGDVLELKNKINDMVDNLNDLNTEITKAICEVGAEGNMGAQPVTSSAFGSWKILSDNVRALAANHTNEAKGAADQIKIVSAAAKAVAEGDLSQKLTVDATGEVMIIRDAINRMIDNINHFSSEMTRFSREVGSEGKFGSRISIPGATGRWKELVDNVNAMTGTLTEQVGNITQVATAVAGGDLSQGVTVQAQGEMLLMKNAVNCMVDNLKRVAIEVKRVARMAGQEGKLSERAIVDGVGGGWREMIDTLNKLLDSIGAPVQEITRLATVLSNGDLTQRMNVQAVGDIKIMADTFNGSLDNLSSMIKHAMSSSAKVLASSSQLVTSSKQANDAFLQATVTATQFAERTKEQSKKLEGSTRFIADLCGFIGQDAEHAKIEEVSLEAKRFIERGGESSQQAIDKLKRVDEIVKDNADTLKGLGRSAREVGNIIGMTKDIAEHANLLAFNAAIEAAHAGDEGWGFAVIADEIRRLADDTKRAAMQVEGVVGTISETVTDAVDDMKVGAVRVSDNIDTANQAISILGRIGHNAMEMVSKAQGVFQSVLKQADSAKQVADNVEEVARTSQQAAMSVDQISTSIGRQKVYMQKVAGTSQRLSNLSFELKGALGRFKVHGYHDFEGVDIGLSDDMADPGMV